MNGQVLSFVAMQSSSPTLAQGGFGFEVVSPTAVLFRLLGRLLGMVGDGIGSCLPIGEPAGRW